MQLQFTAVFERVPEGYIGYVEELPGANTQAETLEEARLSLGEAAQLVLDANRVLAEDRLGERNAIREPLHITA
jgi:predicted RNase H-like HicB family nuclease